MQIKEISIDKITVVGSLNSKMVYALQTLINEQHVRIKGSPLTDYVEGQFFFYGDQGEPVYFSYDEINAKAMEKRNFRMEFNPSKITPEQVKWLQDRIIYILDDVALTRLDLAFDCDFDLSEYTFEFRNPRKSSEFRGKTGKIETMYFGSRNSDIYHRIYDKKQELKDKQNVIIDDPVLWRYEIEFKNAHAIESLIDTEFPIFEENRIIQYDLDDLDINDNLVITALLVKPALMGRLSGYKRRKYRKMMKTLGGNDLTEMFKAELDKKKPELIRKINSWLGVSLV